MIGVNSNDMSIVNWNIRSLKFEKSNRGFKEIEVILIKRGSSDIGSSNRLRKKVLLSRKYIR